MMTIDKSYLPKDKNARIAIIGAGPSGIHMAYLLKREGYSKVVIFEKSERIGGKTHSVKYKDVYHELGTTGFALERGSPLMALLDDVVPKDGNLTFSCSILEMLKKSWMPFLPKTFNQKAAFFSKYLIARIKFYRIYKELRKKGYPYSVGVEDKETLTLLGLPMDEFLRQNNMATLIDIIGQRFSAYGYGRLSEIPVYYGLLLLEKNFLSSPRYMKFSTGNKTLWELTVKKAEIDVRLGCELTDLNYSNFDDSGTVEVIVRDLNGEIQPHIFDAAFISTPHLIADKLPPHDATIFQKIVSNQYLAILATLDKLPCDTYIANYPDKTSVDFDYETLVLINFGRWMEMLTKSAPQALDVFTCLLLSIKNDPNNFEMTQAEILAKFRTDLKEKFRTDYKELLAFHEWSHYCQRLPGNSIANGALSKVNNQQGKHGIWYIGGCLAGELVSLNTEFNTVLIDTYRHPS